MAREVSESGFEFLLSELLSLSLRFPKSDDEGDRCEGDRDFAAQRLELAGFDVGFRYSEKIMPQSRFLGLEPLDLVKFVCKEFWEELFRKKIDKLQTNHRGVFVLSDFKFKWLERYTFNDPAIKAEANLILQYACGILRGAFTNLGLTTTVSAEYSNLPACTFNVRVKNL